MKFNFLPWTLTKQIYINHAGILSYNAAFDTKIIGNRISQDSIAYVSQHHSDT